MKIIVADDDISQRLYIGALLRRAGHECILCSGGKEVLAALASSDAAFVVSDVQMPDLDGLAVSRAIRATDYGRYVYILLITATSEASSYVLCLDAGADDFMAKPVDPATLAARMTAAARVLSYDQALRDQARVLAAAREQIDLDIAAAGAAQRALLPPAMVSHLHGCEIAYLFMPAHQVSGDMFNYFALDDDRVGFYAADVSGHGVRSALLAATLGHIVSPAYFRERSSPGDALKTDHADLADPGRLATRLNERFVRSDYDDTYFTLVSGVIDRRADTLSFCQAGHPHPLLIRPDGSTSWLGEGGLPVGLFEDASWTTERIRFDLGTRLLLHSDGVIEAAAPGGEPYGEHRLNEFALQRRTATAAELCNDLSAELRDWMGGDANADDITTIVIDRQE